jgi:hemerythrin
MLFTNVKHAITNLFGRQHKYVMMPIPDYISKNDADHREILSHLAMVPSGEIAQLSWLYSCMDILVDHFEYEEKWMQEINYPGFDLHQRVHKEYLRLLKNIITDTSRNPEHIAESIEMFSKAITTHKEAEAISLKLYYSDTVPAPLSK